MCPRIYNNPPLELFWANHDFVTRCLKTLDVVCENSHDDDILIISPKSFEALKVDFCRSSVMFWTLNVLHSAGLGQLRKPNKKSATQRWTLSRSSIWQSNVADQKGLDHRISEMTEQHLVNWMAYEQTQTGRKGWWWLFWYCHVDELESDDKPELNQSRLAMHVSCECEILWIRSVISTGNGRSIQSTMITTWPPISWEPCARVETND